MSGAAVVVFHTDDRDSEEELVREYVGPALRRLRDADGFERARFFRHGQDPTLPGGEVRFVVEGEFEALVERERPRWDALEAEGRVDSWTVEGYPEGVPTPGADTEDAAALQTVAAETAVRLAASFDGRLPPVGTDDAGRPSGWWLFVSLLANQLGYAWDDEIDAHVYATEHRLRELAHYEGTGYALRRLEAVRQAVDDTERALIDDASR